MIFGDKEIYLQVQEMFCVEAPLQIAEANSFFKEGKFADAERCLHTLKGFAATLGANSLQTLAAKSEAYLKSLPKTEIPKEARDTFYHLLEDAENLLVKVIKEITNSNDNKNSSG